VDASSVGMISDRDGSKQTLITAAHTHPDEVLWCLRFIGGVVTRALVAAMKWTPGVARALRVAKAAPADSRQVNGSGHLTTIDHGTRLVPPAPSGASSWLLAALFPLR
jgi:hypothetical protein